MEYTKPAGLYRHIIILFVAAARWNRNNKNLPNDKNLIWCLLKLFEVKGIPNLPTAG